MGRCSRAGAPSGGMTTLTSPEGRDTGGVGVWRRSESMWRPYGVTVRVGGGAVLTPGSARPRSGGLRLLGPFHPVRRRQCVQCDRRAPLHPMLHGRMGSRRGHARAPLSRPLHHPDPSSLRFLWLAVARRVPDGAAGVGGVARACRRRRGRVALSSTSSWRFWRAGYALHWRPAYTSAQASRRFLHGRFAPPAVPCTGAQALSGSLPLMVAFGDGLIWHSSGQDGSIRRLSNSNSK